jgi:hypothetical protein
MVILEIKILREKQERFMMEKRTLALGIAAYLMYSAWNLPVAHSRQEFLIKLAITIPCSLAISVLTTIAFQGKKS